MFAAWHDARARFPFERQRLPPRGRKNNRTTIEEIADFKVKIELPGHKSRRMSLWEAGIWRMVIKGSTAI
jgi:hypothetical protein